MQSSNSIKHMHKCIECNKPIVSFGRARKNGKLHDDWDCRNLHKKCFIERRKREELEWMHEEYMRKNADRLVGLVGTIFD